MKRLAPWERFPYGYEPKEEDYYEFSQKDISQGRVIWSDKIIDPEEMWRYTWAAVNMRTGNAHKQAKWWLHIDKMPGLSRPKDYKQLHPNMVEQYTDKRCLPILKKIMKLNGQFGPCCQGHFPTKESVQKTWAQWMKKRVMLKKGLKPFKLMNPWTGGTERYSNIPLGDINTSNGVPETVKPAGRYENYNPWREKKSNAIYVPAYLRFSDYYQDLIQYNGKGAFIATIDTLIQDFKDIKRIEKIGFVS